MITEKYEDPILQKILDMMDYAYIALRQFPKSEKFGLAADIKRIMDEELGLAIAASKKYFKKTTLQDLDIANMKLKFYVRLAHRLHFLPERKYELWSERVVEIGRIIGGWKNSVKQ